VLDAAKKLRLSHLEDEEDRIILKAIMDVNLPKFSSSDVPLFQVQ
jgi:dynein heavy chain, axonemal